MRPDPAAARRLSRLELPDGRILEPGTEFTVPGEGRFSFRYGWLTATGTEVTCYGPVTNLQVASIRTFRPDRVRTIHRSKPA